MTEAQAPWPAFELATCPIDGCPNRHQTNRLMCRRHWFTVPLELRDEVWRAWREEGVSSERYREARDAAIAAAEP